MRITRNVPIRNGQKYNLWTELKKEGVTLPETIVVKNVICGRVYKDGKPIDSDTVVEAKTIFHKYFVEVKTKDDNVPSSMLMFSMNYGILETFRTQEIEDDTYSVHLQIDLA